MSKSERALSAAMAAPLGLLVAMSSPGAMAQTFEYEKSHLFFELNDSSDEIGVHSYVDGPKWKRLWIRDLNGLRIFNLYIHGALRQQGVTKLKFGSAAESFDDLAPADFFARFPEGTYEIEGRTLTGHIIKNLADVSHVMPAAPVVMVDGYPLGTNCDVEDEGFDAPTVYGGDLYWDPVTMSHPDADGGGAGAQPPVPVSIMNYVVKSEVIGEGSETKVKAKLASDMNHYYVPYELTYYGGPAMIKVAVKAVGENYNQTVTEGCFIIDHSIIPEDPGEGEEEEGANS